MASSSCSSCFLPSFCESSSSSASSFSFSLPPWLRFGALFLSSSLSVFSFPFFFFNFSLSLPSYSFSLFCVSFSLFNLLFLCSVFSSSLYPLLSFLLLFFPIFSLLYHRWDLSLLPFLLLFPFSHSLFISLSSTSYLLLCLFICYLFSILFPALTCFSLFFPSLFSLPFSYFLFSLRSLLPFIRPLTSIVLIIFFLFRPCLISPFFLFFTSSFYCFSPFALFANFSLPLVLLCLRLSPSSYLYCHMWRRRWHRQAPHPLSLPSSPPPPTLLRYAFRLSSTPAPHPSPLLLMPPPSRNLLLLRLSSPSPYHSQTLPSFSPQSPSTS